MGVAVGTDWLAFANPDADGKRNRAVPDGTI
jgi:hypothetical protein